MTPIHELPQVLADVLKDANKDTQAKNQLDVLQAATSRALGKYSSWRAQKVQELVDTDPVAKIGSQISARMRAQGSHPLSRHSTNTTTRFTAIYNTHEGLLEVDVRCSTEDKRKPDPNDIEVTIKVEGFQKEFIAAQADDPNTVRAYTELMFDIATNPEVSFKFP